MPKCPHCGSSNPDDALFCAECGKKIVDGKAGPGLQTVSDLETIDSLTPRREGGEDMTLSAGTEFAGRYVIEELVGRGGMGAVYRAHDKLVDKTIALKLIRRDRLGGEGALKRLISEGVLTRDIRHSNVVAVYDVGEAEQRPFVSMEYLDGISLRAWLRKQGQDGGDVPLPVSTRIIREILAGLEAAHQKGVVHRDLKPENIILLEEPSGEQASLKILDFGIARAAGAVAESSTGTGLGTPRYMAPEQITNADAAGPSADFYSLSIIFYEMLVGVLPQGHWQPPSGGRSDIPPAIDRLIESGLSNRAASRPQSTADYRAELDQAMQDYSPPATKDETPVPAPAGNSGSSRKWLGISGAAIAGLVVIGALVSEPEGNGEPEPEVPPSPAPSPPPPSSSSASTLSGSWVDAENGASYQVQVGQDGSFSGSGNAGGMPVTIQGGFEGQGARYAVIAGGLQYPGSMQWDGQCHINWRTDDGSGGRIHVNHPPGAPCP